MTFVLYESWCKSDSNVDINEYTSHNFYRKFQHRRVRRCSGSLVINYKVSLKEGGH